MKPIRCTPLNPAQVRLRNDSDDADGNYSAEEPARAAFVRNLHASDIDAVRSEYGEDRATYLIGAWRDLSGISSAAKMDNGGYRALLSCLSPCTVRAKQTGEETRSHENHGRRTAPAHVLESGNSVATWSGRYCGADLITTGGYRVRAGIKIGSFTRLKSGLFAYGIDTGPLYRMGGTRLLVFAHGIEPTRLHANKRGGTGLKPFFAAL